MTKKLEIKLTTGRQFVGYFTVGLLATFNHYAVLMLLVECQFLSPTPASLIGFICGGLTGFLLNSRYVFQKKRTSKALAKYFILAATSASINTWLMHTLHEQFAWHYLLAQVLATGSVFVWNFICCRLWVFSEATHV